MNGIPDLSIVIPAFQERDTIVETLEALLEALPLSSSPFEIVVVDDGSTDGTAELVEKVADRNASTIRVITHPYNRGNGAAVKSGIRASRGRFIVCMDADGQHDARDVVRAVSLMGPYHLVIGARSWQGMSGPWYRTLANRFYSWLASGLTGFQVEDLTSGFRVFDARVVRRFVDLFPDRFSYPTTSTLAFLKAGYHVKYLQIDVGARKGTASKVRVISDGWKFLLIIFKIAVLFRPLRVFGPTALLFAALGAASTLYGMWSVQRLYVPNSAVILLSGALITFLLGLIAEQNAALQILTRDRYSPAPDEDSRYS